MSTSAADGGAAELAALQAAYAAEEYVLAVSRSTGRVLVALKPGASGETVLKVWLHVAEIGEEGAAGALEMANDAWPTLRAAVEEHGWTMASLHPDRCCGPVRVRM